MVDNAYTGKQGRIWVQPGGANNPVYLLACADLGDLSEPLGGISLLRCYGNDGKLTVVGQTESPPDPVTTTIDELLFAERSWIESLDCPFALYILQRCGGGRADLFSNYQRGELLTNARISQRTYSGLVKREEDEESMLSSDIEAWPPLVKIDLLKTTILGDDIGNEDLVDVVANMESRCVNECGLPELPLGAVVYALTDAPTGAQSEVYYSTDYGATFTKTTTNPLAVNDVQASAITRIVMGLNSVRLLVSRLGAGAAVQGQIAYTDDNGATAWTIVSVGGAAAGHGAVEAGGLFSAGRNFVFLASAAGYIYKSTDGGETWTAVEEGDITVGDYLHIHFADDTYGIAGAEAGVVALSDDGGETWYQTAANPSAQNIVAVTRLDKVRLWADDVSGDKWYSNDGGATWLQRTGWTGSGVASIEDVRFLDEFHGWMVKKDAGGDSHVLHTFNGGHDWYEIPAPADTVLRAVWPVKPDLAYAVGTISPVAGSAGANLAVVLRIEPAN